MRPTKRKICVFLLAASVGAVCSVPPTVRAGDDDDLTDDAPVRQERNQEFQVRIQNVEANIDGWIFGNRRNVSGGRQRLDSMLKTKTDEICRGAELTEAQKHKLLLAGEGDIRRFNERVEALKKKYQGTQFGQNVWQNLFQEVRPLQTALRAGLFGDDSLFAKTLRKTLSPGQMASYRRAEEARRTFQYRARVEMTVMRLGSFLGLGQDQRQRLVQLLAEKTRPPRTFGPQDQYVVLVQMSRLPEETLKPLFDAGQWRALQHQFEGVPQFLAILRQNGIVLEGDEPRNAPVAPVARQAGGF